MAAKKKKQRDPFQLEDSLEAWVLTTREVLADLTKMPPDEAARVARELVVRFAEEHPGQTIYVAKGSLYRLDVRDQEIYAMFNGHNYNEVARAFDVTPRHVRRVVRRAKAIDTLQRIDDMFPGREIPDRH